MNDALRAFCTACALDLVTLAQLHDRELDEQMVAALRAERFPLGLGLRLDSAEGREVSDAFADVIDGLSLASPHGDDLAADFAAIYLTHAIGASPCESVWLDDDGLAMQAPMFEVREAYARRGLHAADWRKRPDDHLVFQLQFVATLLEGDGGEDAPAEAAAFVDAHLMRWLPDFAGRVAHRAATPFYAHLAAYTAVYLDELRDLLGEITGVSRPVAQVEEATGKGGESASAAIPAAYVPGSAPSW